MTSLACCISIVVSPPCGSSIFPAYRGSALVKTMPSSHSCLVCIRLSHPLNLLLLRLGFSTKQQRQCLHFTRVCGLCHHPSLSNSGNVSGHHLADGFWSSFVRFVASFSSVQICHPCHLSSYFRWLCPLIWTWKSTMLSCPSPASCRLIDHRAFFTDSTKRPPMIDWCDFYYFVRNGLVALLEALCARILFFRFVNTSFVWQFFFLFCVCARPLSLTKALLPPLSTRLLCLVVATPLVCWLYMCVCVCVPLYVHTKMYR